MKSQEGEEALASGLRMKQVSRPTLVPLKSSTLVQSRSVDKLLFDIYVRSLTGLFSVKVFESRGMQVCEEAVKLLKNGKRKPIKVIGSL